MKRPTTVKIDPEKEFSLKDFLGAAREGARAALGNGAVSSIKRGHEALCKLLEDPSRRIYGIHTGFGGLQEDRIEEGALERHQRDLVANHACGVGEPLAQEEVRGLMYLRLRALSRGYSGISLPAFEAYLEVFNSGKCAHVPSRGSVGASGDLVPLAHAAMPALELIKAGSLGPRDGLALINGTEASQSLALLALADAQVLLASAINVCALTLYSVAGKSEAWSHVVTGLKKHPELSEAASLLSHHLGAHSSGGLPQDPYSLRAAPHLFGASMKLIRTAAEMLFAEADSVTDNPVIIPGNPPQAVHGANFHGIQVAVAADMLAWAVHLMGVAGERRTDYLLSGRRAGLTPMLPAHPHSSGLMMIQVVQGALVAENRLLCHPASADSIPSSAGQEDVVPMAMSASLKLRRVVRQCAWVVAGEALAAGRAVGQSGRLGELRQHTKLASLVGVLERAAGPALWKEDRGFSKALENIASALLLRKEIE